MKSNEEYQCVNNIKHILDKTTLDALEKES